MSAENKLQYNQFKQIKSNSKLDDGLVFHWLGRKCFENWVDLIWRQGTAVQLRSDSDRAERFEKVEKVESKSLQPSYQLLPPPNSWVYPPPIRPVCLQRICHFSTSRAECKKLSLTNRSAQKWKMTIFRCAGSWHPLDP